jgi:hypothetical protein
MSKYLHFTIKGTIIKNFNTVTCRVVHVTKRQALVRIIGFISTSVTSSLNRSYSPIPIHTIYSSPLGMHYESPTALVVS